MLTEKSLIKLNPDQILYKQNDPATELFVIKKGSIGVYQKTVNGEVEDLLELKEGQLVGDLSFFDRKPRSSFAKALSESEVIGVPYSLVQKDYQELKPWFKIMLKVMANQVRQLATELKELSPHRFSSTKKNKQLSLQFLHALIGSLQIYGSFKDDLAFIEVEKLKKSCLLVHGMPNKVLNPLIDFLTNLDLFTLKTINEKHVLMTQSYQKLIATAQILLEHIASNRLIFEAPQPERRILQILRLVGNQFEADWKGNIRVLAPHILTHRIAKKEKLSAIIFNSLIQKGLPIKKHNYQGQLLIEYHLSDITSFSIACDLIEIFEKLGLND